MIRTCTKIIRFAIGASRVDMTLREIRKDLKIDFYPIVGYKQQKLGACMLNQPANQNILTEEFVDQFYRFMLSYQFDHSVENIWIQSKESVFSHGVDYKRLTEDKNYLDKLAKFAILFAKMNKPIFAQVAGGAKGVGAYLLSMITMPIGYKNAFMKIDDTMRGLTPLMGGSHRLTRLPLHVGYYLALTGDQFNFEEMTQIGYIKGTVCNDVTNHEIRSKLEEANLYFREKFKYTDFDESRLEQQEKQYVQNNEEKFKENLKYRQGELLSKSSKNLNLKFAVNQHLAASADYFNATNTYNSFSQAAERNINNYYQLRLERPLKYLKDHNMVEVFELDGIEIPRLDLARIDYIFAKDSLQEIIQDLKEEKSQWAQRAYKKIMSSDPLALHLTFNLLKKAESRPWIECLENEFTVARRLIENSELKLKTYKNSSQYALVNEYSGKSISEVPQSVIDSYLAPGEGEHKLDHTVSPSSLHPYSEYYKILPDNIRKYLNQQQLNEAILNEQVPQVMRYLNKNKINYSSQVYDINVLRRYVFEKLQLQKDKEDILKRLTFISRNDAFLQKYQHQRELFLDSISEEALEAKIKEEINNVFKTKFEERFKDFEDKTANIIGLQSKISLYKNIKNVILNNLLYNGAAYENYQKNNTSYNGPIYFDPQGRDIYSTTNPHITSNPALNEFTKDMSKGLKLSEEFLLHSNQEMPTYISTPEVPLQEREIEERKMWELIKFRYDEKPEVWAEAYIYKEMVEQASKTSEELSGYLEWSFENFHDLLNYSEKSKQTYGEFAADIVTELRSIRRTNMQKLAEVEVQRRAVAQKSIFSKIHQYKDEQKMRQCFPYYTNESVIPGEFRRSFLSVLDSTLQEFTEINKDNKKKLLFKEELGVVDRWINKDIATNYTQLLKNDVEYVTSYLQILMVKDMLVVLREFREEDRPLEHVLQIIREEYNVDFHFNSHSISLKDVHAKIFSFLYFLMDLHTNAKKNIKSPQAKLIDFINRLKQSHEQNPISSMPYSFESLILMIAKDRKRIYDRFLGEQFISEPEFYLQHITRESKRSGNDILLRKDYTKEVNKITFKGFVDKYNDVYQHEKKNLIQNYFYYMILFEKHIHEVCGKENFMPTGFINEEHKIYNNYCQKLFRPKSFDQWLSDELKIVVDQLLNERYQAEKNLTKGELYLYDQTFHEKFKASNIRLLIQKKIQEEISILKNMFGQRREYDYEATQEEISDEIYTRAKRGIKNTEALKRINNLTVAEQITLEYMEKADQVEHMTAAERKFARHEKQFLRAGFASRLPSKSYHRMARDLFVYPEEMNPPQSHEQMQLFKKTHITFSKSVGQKIILSNFTQEYKTLSEKMKDDILNEMVAKVKAVESL